MYSATTMVAAAAAAAAATAQRVASESVVVANGNRTCGRCRGREVLDGTQVVTVSLVIRIAGWQPIGDAYQ